MADNRRAGERTIFRGDVEGNDTLAEISRALETERRTPIAVGAGFTPPAGGQASNIPAMADLEDELLREFALYEGPREPVGREPAAREPVRKLEPTFEPAVRAPASVAPTVTVAPVVNEDDDDTMPPMDAGNVFRAVRPAPIVRTPAVVSEPVREAARVEPEPPVVFAPEPDADVDIVPDAAFESSQEGNEEPVEFAGPIPDLADWDLLDEVASETVAGDPAVAVAGDAAMEAELEQSLGVLDLVPDAAVAPVADDAEPVFDGPVPDFDFDEEPVFASSVPELALDDMDQDAGEPVFAGPVPDFDFSEPEADASAEPEAQELHAVADMEAELEQSVGALDLKPDAAVEPVSPFAAWKNDRLAALETTTPAWLSAGALAPKWAAPADVAAVAEAAPQAVAAAEAPVSVEPVPVEPVSVEAVSVEALSSETLALDKSEAPSASAEPENDLFSDFEFDLEADDLVAAPAATAQEPPATEVVALASEEPHDEGEPEPAFVHEPYVSVEPDLHAFSVKPDAFTAAGPVAAALGAPAAVAVDPVAELPGWLTSGRKSVEPIAATPAQKEADFDFKDFEFDFDEDAIEAEVSRAVMTELQAAPAKPPVDEMPFDPSAITEIEDTMPASFGTMDVPQVPEQDGEMPPKPVSDFDYDIEAEMAELFAMGSKPREQSASALADGQRDGEDDGLDNGLANELIRSIHETPAIPAGRAFDMTDIDSQPKGFVARYARVAAAAAIVAFAGLGAVMLWRSGDVPGVAGDGTPRVIMADKSPIKEVPDQPGGKQVPNQDKAVYERVAGKSPEVVKQGSLIANAEEPVNVSEKTLGDDGAMPSDAQAPGVADASDADARLPATPSQPGADGDKSKESVSPRKVKTMIVLPNGTLVARETTAPAEPPKSSAADAVMTAPAATANVEASQPASTIAPANGAPATQASQQAAAKPMTAPIPTARPAEQPVNVVGTVTQRGNVAGQQTAAAEKPAAQAAAKSSQPTQQPVAPAASSTPAGAYVIQIASLPSQEEARKSYSNLSAKFSSVIGGKSMDIKPAEIPGKGTYYRLRIVAGSKDEAIALCSRYRAAGGSCLVSR